MEATNNQPPPGADMTTNEKLPLVAGRVNNLKPIRFDRSIEHWPHYRAGNPDVDMSGEYYRAEDVRALLADILEPLVGQTLDYWESEKLAIEIITAALPSLTRKEADRE